MGWDFPEKRWSHLLLIVVEKDPDLIDFQERTRGFLKIISETKIFQRRYPAGIRRHNNVIMTSFDDQP
jgi:hypothetical protein